MTTGDIPLPPDPSQQLPGDELSTGEDCENAEHEIDRAAWVAADNRVVEHLGVAGFDTRTIVELRAKYPDFTSMDFHGQVRLQEQNLTGLIDDCMFEGDEAGASAAQTHLDHLRNIRANLEFMTHLSRCIMDTSGEYWTGTEKVEMQIRVLANEVLTSEQKRQWVLVIGELLPGEDLDMSNPQSLIYVQAEVEIARHDESYRTVRRMFMDDLRPVLDQALQDCSVVPSDELPSLCESVLKIVANDGLMPDRPESVRVHETQALYGCAERAGVCDTVLMQILEKLRQASSGA